jgi:ATP-dependent DNA helicase RecQ
VKTRDVGIPAIHDTIQHSGLLAADSCRMYSSKAITVCPVCKSFRITYDRTTRTHTCSDCANRFTMPSNVADNWDDYLRKTQDAFKLDRFPVMVATKGYGMGIDKRNIRAISHFTFASGLEGYYQEVGRAGRDRQHAHGALIYVPPAPMCANKHLHGAATDGSAPFSLLEPDCAVVGSQGYQFWRCPHRLPSLCDYGMQARFITGSYPGVAEDVEVALKHYDTLSTANTQVSSFRVKDADTNQNPKDRDKIKNVAEVAIYRLQQLGICRPPLLQYQGLMQCTLFVTRLEWSPAGLFVNLRQALVALVLSEKERRLQRIDEKLAMLKSQPYAQRASRSTISAIDYAADRRKLVMAALYILIDETYANVKTMRYNMLYNLWRYATADEDPECRCRRSYLLAPFEDGVTTDHLCGFCDICEPDLDFVEDMARQKPEDASLEELNRELPNILSTFDEEVLDRTIRLCEQRSALLSLQLRSASHLEHDPGNLPALDLASAAALARGDGDAALMYCANGYNENERAVGSGSTARRFYGRAKRANAIQAVDLIDRAGGLFDSADGRRYVRDELSVLGGKVDTERLAIAQAVVSLDVIDRLAATVAAPSIRSLVSDLLAD